MSGWTAERVALLTKSWAKGLSCSQIGSILGVSRGGIAGKIRRLGLTGKSTRVSMPKTGRPRTASPTRAPRRAVATQAGASAAPLPWSPKADGYEPPIEQRKTLLQLTAHTCRYPFGDPASEEFYFCGDLTKDDRPYCAHHCAIAFEPLTARARKGVERFATIDNPRRATYGHG